MDAYWEDKVARLDRITVPAYVTAGWNTALHSRGSIDGFRGIASAHRWLVAHREFEWPYFYTPENLEDLRRFFDRYLKGIRNGWELTPRVRIDVMDADDCDHASKRPEAEFPLARTQYRELFLDAAAKSLSPVPAAEESFVGYEAEAGKAAFEMTFDQQTELTGFMKLRLWVQARGAADMDLIVTVQKADADGDLVPTVSAAGPHPGVSGMLRASCRELDEDRSAAYQPVYTYRREQLLDDGQVVPLEIAIDPSSRIWHPGERLRLVVAGHVEDLTGFGSASAMDLRSRGEHVIHTGGRFDSHLLVPVIPSRRPAGHGRSQEEARTRFVEQQIGSDQTAVTS